MVPDQYLTHPFFGALGPDRAQGPPKKARKSGVGKGVRQVKPSMRNWLAGANFSPRGAAPQTTLLRGRIEERLLGMEVAGAMARIGIKREETKDQGVFT